MDFWAELDKLRRNETKVRPRPSNENERLALAYVEYRIAAVQERDRALAQAKADELRALPCSAELTAFLEGERAGSVEKNAALCLRLVAPLPPFQEWFWEIERLRALNVAYYDSGDEDNALSFAELGLKATEGKPAHAKRSECYYAIGVNAAALGDEARLAGAVRGIERDLAAHGHAVYQSVLIYLKQLLCLGYRSPAASRAELEPLVKDTVGEEREQLLFLLARLSLLEGESAQMERWKAELILHAKQTVGARYPGFVPFLEIERRFLRREYATALALLKAFDRRSVGYELEPSIWIIEALSRFRTMGIPGGDALQLIPRARRDSAYDLGWSRALAHVARLIRADDSSLRELEAAALTEMARGHSLGAARLHGALVDLWIQARDLSAFEAGMPRLLQASRDSGDAYGEAFYLTLWEAHLEAKGQLPEKAHRSRKRQLLAALDLDFERALQDFPYRSFLAPEAPGETAIQTDGVYTGGRRVLLWSECPPKIEAFLRALGPAPTSQEALAQKIWNEEFDPSIHDQRLRTLVSMARSFLRERRIAGLAIVSEKKAGYRFEFAASGSRPEPRRRRKGHRRS